jgi:Zn-dependent membrane protease YugP
MAAVAMVLAWLAIAAAVFNRDHYYRWSKIRWIDQRWGRTTARAIYAAAGLLMAATAVLILRGWSAIR